MNYIEKIKIDNTDIFLEDMKEGQGKITISDTYGHNYSAYWGAMGGNIRTFLCEINSDYFAHKLISIFDERQIDIKKTFRNLRMFIRDELDLPFYKEMEFQKDMRKNLNEFQYACEEMGADYFVNSFFSHFINSLDFYLIEDDWDKKEIEESFSNISEHWSFLEEKPSENYVWLQNFHNKLKRVL